MRGQAAPCKEITLAPVLAGGRGSNGAGLCCGTLWLGGKRPPTPAPGGMLHMGEDSNEIGFKEGMNHGPAGGRRFGSLNWVQFGSCPRDRAAKEAAQLFFELLAYFTPPHTMRNDPISSPGLSPVSPAQGAAPSADSRRRLLSSAFASR